jgi:hypothetical protein
VPELFGGVRQLYEQTDHKKSKYSSYNSELLLQCGGRGERGGNLVG